MNEIVMWVSNLLSFFAIVVAAIVLIWQTDKQHKNNIKLTAIAKLQRELDAVKKLWVILGFYQAITKQTIAKIDDCLAETCPLDSIPMILQHWSSHYASFRNTASVIFDELRAEEAEIFCNFLAQAFTAERILVISELANETEEDVKGKLIVKKGMLNECNDQFVELARCANKAIKDITKKLNS